MLVPPRCRVRSTLSLAVRPLIRLVRDRFYGIYLNHNVVLQQIGYDGKESGGPDYYCPRILHLDPDDWVANGFKSKDSFQQLYSVRFIFSRLTH